MTGATAVARTPLLLGGLLDWVLDDVWGTVLDALAALTGVEMLSYPFMQRAYLAAVCIAVIGPLVGSFLVHREMAMIGDTLAHSAFAGVAVGLFVNATFALSVPPLLTALVVAVVAAVLVQLLVDRVGTYTDTSLAVVLTGAFAVGSVLITATDGGIAVGINAYLFGSLATVTRENVGILFAMTLLVTAVVALAYRPLLYATFDEVGARAAGLHVGRYNLLLVVLTAVVVVAAMQIMGVILVAAMLVIPVATAGGMRGFRRSVAAAVLTGLVATVSGATLSYVYDVAAGGSIVLVAIAVYAAVGAGRAARAPVATAVQTLRTARTVDGRTVEADGGAGPDGRD
ncbi:metal ABC transporter permease [Haloarchaeobius sp. FL176]|uniref:metal ABC transporter permease n=1 Tax=Haloarchaeobius sp. FL176 TaxID=2967129 RepID=UPI00214819AD|nr:metal ABC transporter permease [Haloarchaeobius sp. FL176]